MVNLDWVAKLAESSSIVRLVLALAALIGAIVTIATITRTTYRWYDNHFRWANRTENQLEGLRANVTIQEFDNKLGTPRLRTISKSGRSVQHIYQGRGYWVQAVTDKTEAVAMFAVTACDERLHPKWEVWNGRDKNVAIELNGSTILDSSRDLEPTGYQWFISGATANTYIYSLFGAGNPSNYQTYAWGHNDVCSDDSSWNLTEEEGAALFEHPMSGSPSDEDEFADFAGTIPPAVAGAFSKITANTFAIFGVFRDVGDSRQEFQIGADRILTRTLD